ncbi:MAG: rhamnogalacturonan acetylesterase [Opitutaceae bacterium]
MSSLFSGLGRVFLVFLTLQLSLAAAPTRSWHFSLGEASAADAVRVAPGEVYTAARGYGFEPGSAVTLADKGGGLTSERPFLFSVKVPEGNYRVTVALGGGATASNTTIKAELRRLMIESVGTAPGEVTMRTFNVNVRTPQFGEGAKVRLKERELTTEFVNWDNKLTLEFNGPRPVVNAIEITPLTDAVTVYLLGDSTVCDQPKEPWNSWGQMLPRFFDTGVVIANHAESGESLRSSLSARRLDKVLSTLRAGDYLFIQYGHNDMKEKGEGVGAFTSYQADLRRFVLAARAVGGIPVLVTSMHRKSLDAEGKIQNTLGDYPAAVRALAAAEHVPLIDLHAMSGRLYEALGPAQIGAAFQDGTHHNNYGSYELAQCIVAGVRTAALPLAKHILAEVPDFNPARPDAVASFVMPSSPQATALKPDGS